MGPERLGNQETRGELGRPRRRLYAMTGVGKKYARSAIKEVRIGDWDWDARMAIFLIVGASLMALFGAFLGRPIETVGPRA